MTRGRHAFWESAGESQCRDASEAVGATALIVGGGAGLASGYLLGDARALDYRLRAQLALCQVKIQEDAVGRRE